jgi:hypothetical protein
MSKEIWMLKDDDTPIFSSFVIRASSFSAPPCLEIICHFDLAVYFPTYQIHPSTCPAPWD